MIEFPNALFCARKCSEVKCSEDGEKLLFGFSALSKGRKGLSCGGNIVFLSSQNTYFDMSDKIYLTGDRPTGRLHIGHYVGSLRRRVEIQNTDDYKAFYVFIADAQALTDNMDKDRKSVV